MSTLDSKVASTVLVVGAGPVGLINARTLVRDGFRVTLITKDDGVGGCWRSTYPDLTTNSPWGSFTFSGLTMARPSSLDGSFVPARTYLRYLEDFQHYFLDGQTDIRHSTKLLLLRPRTSARGWVARLQSRETTYEECFDRVLLACGLGEPTAINIQRSSPEAVPMLHSSELSTAQAWEIIDELVSHKSSSVKESVTVIGAGKSALDMVLLMTRKGLCVTWLVRGPLKWFAPAVPPGMMGANRLDILMGPSRRIDSWAMWLYHCTICGASRVRAFWHTMRTLWVQAYGNPALVPQTNPFLALSHFAGGVSEKGQLLQNAFKEVATISGQPVSVNNEGIIYETTDGLHLQKCSIVICATGFRFNIGSFFEQDVRKDLGLEPQPPRDDFRRRVRAMRASWITVTHPVEEEAIALPMVFRGILPAGRLAERDLAIAGSTRPYSIPAASYEVESHWISSLFSDDPHLQLPKSMDAILDETHSEHEFLAARYPGHHPYSSGISGSFFAGFNDLFQVRELLRDMQLDPWRQKSNSWLPWRLWDWLDVRIDAEQYASIGDERAARIR